MRVTHILWRELWVNTQLDGECAHLHPGFHGPHRRLSKLVSSVDGWANRRDADEDGWHGGLAEHREAHTDRRNDGETDGRQLDGETVGQGPASDRLETGHLVEVNRRCVVETPLEAHVD